MTKRKVANWTLVIAAVPLTIGIAAWGVSKWQRSVPVAGQAQVQTERSERGEPDPEEQDAKPTATVVRPQKGLLERTTTQPGSIQAYESVRLFAKVPGFLEKQTVDIGYHVKKGQVLAVVDVPELRSQLKRNKAGVEQANARVDQMKSRVRSAEADLDAAKAAVTRAEAAYQSAQAWVRYRQLQYKRMEDLSAQAAIEQRLVDEAREHLEASIETQRAAKEDITVSKAKVVAADARIDQAKADMKEAKAEVDVAEAELEKTQVQVNFATIVAPFDGVVTQRRYFEQDYIRSANESGNEPMLTVERTDLFRVVVQVPDRDVPFCDEGDPAYVMIDALPGRRFPAKVSRKADKEDPVTRLMRVEVDLPNPTGKIRDGMYGQVTIVLDPAKNQLSIPSSCIVGKVEDGAGAVYVVRDGCAKRVSVRLGMDSGLRVAVLSGLTVDDQVILRPGNLSDGTEVVASASSD